MAETASLPQIKKLAQHLPIRDKIRLIEWIAPQIEHDLQTESARPRKSLRGLWSELNLTESEIDQARNEVWRDFPREDI